MPPDGAPTLPDGAPTLPDGAPTLPQDTPSYPDATTQMPVTAAAGGIPPGTPPNTGYGEPFGKQPPTPWYKKPGPLIAAFVVLAALGGVLAWLFFGGDDDDPAASAESSLLVLEVTDETGTPVDAGFIVDVTGPAGAETDYILDPARIGGARRCRRRFDRPGRRSRVRMGADRGQLRPRSPGRPPFRWPSRFRRDGHRQARSSTASSLGPTCRTASCR